MGGRAGGLLTNIGTPQLMYFIVLSAPFLASDAWRIVFFGYGALGLTDAADLGGVASLDNVLKIDGDTGDSLSLDPADGWSAADTSTLPGYAIYAAGNAKVAVDQDITVAVA